MSTLLFLRHAETDLAGTFCGHANPPLNARGWARVEQLARELSEERFNAVYTSDLLRARLMAESFAAESDVPCHARTGLRELYFGAWEGMTWAQIEVHDPDFSARWLKEFPYLPAPAGESVAAFEARVLAEVDALVERHAGQRVLVVTHAGVMRVVLRRWCGASEEEAWKRTEEYGCRFEVNAGAGRFEVGR